MMLEFTQSLRPTQLTHIFLRTLLYSYSYTYLYILACKKRCVCKCICVLSGVQIITGPEFSLRSSHLYVGQLILTIVILYLNSPSLLCRFLV